MPWERSRASSHRRESRGWSRRISCSNSGNLAANGTLAGLDLTAKAEGRQGGQPFALDAGARIDAAGPAKTAVISKLSGKLAGQDVQLGQPATLKLEAGVLDIDRIDLRVAGGRVEGSLTIGDRRRADLAFPERPLTGQVRADLDLQRVAQLAALANQEVKGKLNADLRLGGRVGQPLIDGSASVSNGLVADAMSGAVLRDLTLEIVAQGSRIDLQQLSARGNGAGTLTGKGSVTLAEAGPTGSVTLTFTHLQVLDNEFGTARISGPLQLALEPAALSIASKKLTVDRADLQIPGSTGASIPNLPVTKVNFPGQDGTPRPPPAPPLPVRLDVNVAMPGQVFLRGRGLDSEWGGDLRIQGTAAAPRIIGDIRFRRGLLDLLGRRFNIERGTIRFTGSNPPEPWVDLVASASAADVTAVISLQGVISDPRLVLSSQPPLPQDEVLSRILFGRSTARITPVQGVQLAAAVQELQGGGGISDVLGAIRRSTGLDTLDFTSTDTPQGETQGAIRAGRYVTDNVYVEGQQGTAPGSGRVRVQVDVTPSVSVTTDLSRFRARRPPGCNGSSTTERRRSYRGRRSGPRGPPGAAGGRHDLRHAVRPQPGRAVDALRARRSAASCKVATQTVLAPVITTLVFLAIFALALHRTDTQIGGLPFLQFLAPGLIMMAIVQNAFANTSSSIVIAKVQGNIVDYLMPPLGPGELLLGIVHGRRHPRGCWSASRSGLRMLPFVPSAPPHPLLVLFYACSPASAMLSLLGVLGGLWAEKFDQMAAVTNFVITPLSFLSGTFYSIEALPGRLAAGSPLSTRSST